MRTRHGASERAARAFPVLLGGLLVSAAACDAEPGSADLRISAYGEDFVEDRIPAAEVIDGWEIEFERLLIAISSVEANGVALDGAFVVDLTRPSDGEGHALGVVTLPADDHPDLSFEVAPVDAAQAISADATDLEWMVERGLSVYAQGHATRGDATLRFSWGFATRTRYEECHGLAELESDPEPSTRLTMHADHLFYDDLDSEEPNVAFDLVAAADTNGDGNIEPDELRALDITGQARYQVGGREITDLWGFIEAQTTTLGHIDGEGHCEIGG
ncbi:MAG: hypothetical protein AAGF11_42545 [Myxococcota bacterium]